MQIITCRNLVAIALAILTANSADGAQYTLTTLATFNSGPNGAAKPFADLISDASGNLYSTTYSGGANNLGTVFELASGTHEVTTLATFNGTNGAYPRAGLLMDASGSLYGTTSGDGKNNSGTVFKLAAGTHAMTTLATFTNSDDPNGATPSARLIADGNGNLYGTAVYGGPNGDGTVFEVAAGTHALNALATFDGTNGANPFGGLLADASGNLYGTTSGVGTSNGVGTVFKVAASTRTLTTLASFNGANGAVPYATLIADASGNLFGTTDGGGVYNDGTVFELTSGTNDLITIASFNGANGSNPLYGSLIADGSGNLFGTTCLGGANGYGTVFEVEAGTHTITTLATFDGTNGGYPFNGLFADGNGNLYGTTPGVGANGVGTVFELSPVPEPSTMALCLAAIATGIVLLQGRRDSR